MAADPSFSLRPAVARDYAAIRALTLAVYLDEGLAGPDYRNELADVEGRAQDTELLVITDAEPIGDASTASPGLLGSVAFAPHGSSYAEITRDPGEASFRMLAVHPRARGRGVGRALIQACVDRAGGLGARRMVISTGPRMQAAHRLYDALGFRRDVQRDWSPRPGIDLRCYVLDVDRASDRAPDRNLR